LILLQNWGGSAISGNCSDSKVLCVDDTPGSAQEYSSIQAAVNSVGAGDTILVYPGVYSGKVDISVSGTPNQRIIVKAAEKWKAETNGFSVSGDYITVEGFNITNNGEAVSVSGDHVEIIDNYLHDINDVAINSTGDFTRIANNYIYKPNAGIYVSGKNSIVEGNEVERLVKTGNRDADYSRFFGEGHIFRNNYYHGTNMSEVGNAHVDCFQTFDSNKSSQNILIENNTCYVFHQGLMASAVRRGSTKDIVLRNNIFGHGGNGVIARDGVTGVTIDHNTFVDLDHFAVWLYGGNVNSTIKNNIVYNTASGIVVANDSQADIDYNLSYNSPNPRPNPGAHALLNINPMFVDPAGDNYQPQPGSPVCGAGEGGSDIGAIPCP
jgi:hypothetical protein